MDKNTDGGAQNAVLKTNVHDDQAKSRVPMADGVAPPAAATKDDAIRSSASGADFKKPPPPDAAATSDSDEEPDEVVEESPCGRWWKRREQVKQRDVPGIDVAFLAMDNDTGTEVVWNEVQFSERKNFKAQEEKINTIFDNLTRLNHTNLVKLHKYWTDTKSEKPRVIFITEYMSSGSMSQFLKRTKVNSKNLSEKPWKKWCKQILSALSYLHSCDPAIVHGNLSCNTIFIQQNGLIKIGVVAPNAIHHHVKTFRENMKNMHYIAPEYELGTAAVSPAADIYSFGICALEMARLGFSPGPAAANVAAGASSSSVNGGGVADAAPVVAPAPPSSVVNQDTIEKALLLLDNPLQRDLIRSCLNKDPSLRPTARELLFHTFLFEVHSLLLLAAHHVASNKKIYDNVSEDDIQFRDKTKVAAEIRHRDGRSGISMRYADVGLTEIDKFLEDVSNGIYPLTAFKIPSIQQGSSSQNISSAGGTSGASGAADGGGAAGAESGAANRPHSNQSSVGSGGGVNFMLQKAAQDGSERSLSPFADGGANAVTAGDGETSETTTATEDKRIHGYEIRRVVRISIELKPLDGSNSTRFRLTLLLKLEDMMNRQLTAEIGKSDSPELLVKELVRHGFIREDDLIHVVTVLTEALRTATGQKMAPSPPTEPPSTTISPPGLAKS